MNAQHATKTGLWLACGILLMVATFVAMGPVAGSQRPLVGPIRTDGGKVISAIERYRISHGALPEKLTDLVPGYLPRLEQVRYQYNKAHELPYSLFNRTLSSNWVYKTSHDKSSFALAIEAKPVFVYDSKAANWFFFDKRFENYEKPRAPAAKSTP